jgi:hypothetical protein
MTRIALCVSALLVFGCGDDSSPGATGGSGGGEPMPDAAPPMPDGPDHGAPSTMYPAFQPDMATITNNGGPVLSAMQIVTITWTSDTNAATYEAYGDGIGASQYWHQINAEYGVGPAVSGAANHVHISTMPPTSMTDANIQTLIQTSVADATLNWPQPNHQILYAVYLPNGTDLDLGGSACSQGIGGYHDQITAGGMGVSYAVLPNCSGRVNSVLSAASHEFNEAATDPLPQSHPSWVGFDNDHISFEFFQELQDETGDACEFFRSSFYTDMETMFNYPVQRQWSNASARAGHNPCVPVPSGAFFNVTPFPADEDSIMVNLRAIGAGNHATKGFKGTLMTPRTFAVGFYSDADTGGPWTLSSTIATSLFSSIGSSVTNGTADVSIDKTSGQNGEKAYITVTPKTFNSMGVIYIELVSTLGTAKHYMPILIGQN